MNDMTEMPAPLVFTDSAAMKVRNLIDEEGNPELKLRVFVTGGGCSGFQYGFSLDDSKLEDDVLFERDGVKVVVDTTSLELIRGGEVDFVEELVGSYFQVKNPNATSTCGCGTSFAVG